MATRLYLPSNGPTPVTPAFSVGTWTETAGTDYLRAVTTKIGSPLTSKVRNHTATAAGSRFLSRVYVSDPMGAQTIGAGTVKGTIRVLESAANDNLNAMTLVIRAVSNNGLTFRTPVIYGPTNGTVAEFNTSLRAKRLAVGGATNAVTVQTGDRLVIEIGTTNTVSGTSLSDSINYGDGSASDLGDNETDTAANNPFVELSATINFPQSYTATASATISTLTETNSKLRSLARTIAQTVGTITSDGTSAIASVVQHNRNAIPGEIVGAISETTSRLGAFVRPVPQTLITPPTVTLLGSDTTGGFDDTLLIPSIGLDTDLPVGTLVVLGLQFDLGVSIDQVSDPHSNPYSVLAASNDDISAAIIYSRLTQVLNGGDQVQITFSSECYAAAYGIALNNADAVPLDGWRSASGSSSSFSSGALATTIRRNELLVELMAHTDGLAITAPFAFTDGATLDGEVEDNSSVHLGHRVVTSLGSYTATATINGAEPRPWLALLAAFKVGTGGIENDLRKAPTRTVAAAIATLSELASRGNLYARTVRESLSGFVWGLSAYTDGGYGIGAMLESVIKAAGEAVTRTVAQTLGAISETIASLKTLVRTSSATIATLTEAVVGLVTRVRTTADTVGTLTEAATRLGTFLRPVADSLSAISEAVVAVRSGVNNLVRTAGDNITGALESVVGVVTNHAFTVAVGQSLGAVSESIARGTSAFGRSSADAISAISEAVVAIKSGLTNLARAAADTLGSISESVVTGGSSFSRSAAQALGATSEAVARAAANLARTSGETVATIASVVARGATAWTRNVAQNVGAISEAIGNANQAIGGPAPLSRAFYVIARGTGYSPVPVGSATNPKPKD